jgi:hypothetical protein
MKWFCWILLLSTIATPAMAAKRISVGQLEDLLRSLQQDKKNDTVTATALKQVELSEELTRSIMNNLMSIAPGPRTKEQIYVLEARSADLIPPSSDLPAAPAPDVAKEHAILDRAAAYASGVYDQLPALSATRTTLRFQDNIEVAASSGISGKATADVVPPGFSNPAAFVHFINSTEAQVSIEHGIEQMPTDAPRTNWGANKMIALQEPNPSLGIVLKEAQASSSLKWLRWELVNGRQAAVFSFSIPKKESRLAVNVCCFPVTGQTGNLSSSDRPTGPDMADVSHGATGPVAHGDFQTSTSWSNFKSGVPYHGEFFIDPDSGIVVRMITEAELKPTDVVHQVDTRIDFGPAAVNGKVLIVPLKTVINTEVVPNGESGEGGYATRRTLFTAEYRNYQIADTR